MRDQTIHVAPLYKRLYWSLVHILKKKEALFIFGCFILGFWLWLPKDITVTFKLRGGSEIAADKGDAVEAALVSLPISSPVEQEMTDYEIAICLLKSYESLHLEAYWDVNRWTSGWGTKSKQGEVISIHQANQRAAKHFDKVYNKLNERYPDLDRWDKLILSVMKYNVGQFGPQLISAIESNDKEEIAAIMQKYTRDVKGKKLDGLVDRRKIETKLLLATEKEKQKLGNRFKKTVLAHIQRAVVK